jgi:hypothetical protein
MEGANEITIKEDRPSIQWGDVQIVEFDEYSHEEAKRVWYGENELASICCDALQVASHPTLHSSQRSRKKGSREKDQESMRGLEAMTGQGSNERLRSQASVRKTVLDEQRRQQAMGFCDEGLISLVSRSQSYHDVCRALELGREDEESADAILERVRESPSVVPTTNSSKEQKRVRGSTKHAHTKVGQRMMRFFGRGKVQQLSV